MKKKLLSCACTLTMYFTVFAQEQSGAISGSLRTGDNTQFASATVTLIADPDSSQVKTMRSGKDGNFSFSAVPFGTYRLSVTATGNTAFRSEPFILSSQHPKKTFDPILLSPAQVSLAEVTVLGKRPMIEQRADRTLVNVDAAVTNAGATALDVLEKSPGVTVDKDGNISLKGKQGVIIMIDGKPAYLSGSDLSNLLSSMSAGQLDQVEIMPNPPAKYDAAGNSGIINLKTKKNKAKGFNGNLSAGYGQGKYGKTTNSLALNYRNGNSNLFLNYNNNFLRGYTDLHLMRQYLAQDGKTVYENFDQPTYLNRRYVNNNLKIGMDYNLDQKTTIGFVTTGFISPRRFYGSGTGYLQDADQHTDSISSTISDNRSRWLNGTINLNFRREFSAGNELSADLDYIQYSSASTQLFINQSSYPNGIIASQGQLKGDLPSDITIMSAKMDYGFNLAKNWKLESGVKSSLVKTASDANYFNLTNTVWQADYEKTNHFLYQENINAAYANLNGKAGRWSIQAGLRFENTNYTGHQLGNSLKPDSSFTQQYNSAFPTVYVSYTADTLNQFSISYGRRIDRPAYQDLNPFLFYINAYTYQTGNPYLLPQYTNHVDITHTYKSFLTTSLSYDFTNNYFTQLFRTHGDTTTFGNGNLGTMETIGGSVNAEITVNSWWTSILHLDINYKKVQGQGGGLNINSYGTSGQLNINNQFRFKKGWAAEFSGYYNSLDKEAQFVLRPFGSLSAGISKQVLKNQGTVKLNMRDILFTEVIDGRIAYQNVREHFIQSRDSRVANIVFTYRFGKQLKQIPKHNNGASDEENRVKVNS